MAAAESMVAAIDSLWFHHIILFSHSQPSSSTSTTQYLATCKFLSAITIYVCIYMHACFSFLCVDGFLNFMVIIFKDEICTQETDVLGKETATHDDDHERATRLNLAFARGRSHSSSSPISALQKRWRNRSPLKKSSSLKSMADLELEEVKGFMDLGFVFRRENLSEAWIVRRPSISPLMNDLRIPAVSTAADMKKHLRFWAHTVASAIHQES